MDQDRRLDTMCKRLSSDIKPISKSYYNPPTNLPSTAIGRMLDMTRYNSRVTPYQRNVVSILLEKCFCMFNIKNCDKNKSGEISNSIEQGLYSRYKENYNDYSQKASLIMILLSQSTETSRFSLLLKESILSKKIKPEMLANMTKDNLFPELYLNNYLKDYKPYLIDQFEKEHESMLLMLNRIILSSETEENIKRYELVGPDNLYNSIMDENSNMMFSYDNIEYRIQLKKGNRHEEHYTNLFKLLNNLAQNNTTIPETNISILDDNKIALTKIQSSFIPQIAMLKYYHEIKGKK